MQNFRQKYSNVVAEEAKIGFVKNSSIIRYFGKRSPDPTTGRRTRYNGKKNQVSTPFDDGETKARIILGIRRRTIGRLDFVVRRPNKNTVGS